MHWVGFALVALIGFVLQTTIAWRAAIWGARPDWLLVIVVFYALHARSPQSIAAGWIVGFLADLATIERMGLLSFSYAGTAFLVSWMRDYVFRYQLVTQLAITFLMCLVVHTGLLVFQWAAYGESGRLLGAWLRDGLLTAIYSALWAPIVHFGLLRFSRPLGLPRPRYLYASTR